MERCSPTRHRVPDLMPPLDSLHWSHYQARLVSCHHWMSAYNPWSKSIPSSLSVPVFTSKQCWVVGVGGPDRWICIGVFLPPSPPSSHSLSNIWFSHRLVYVCIHTHTDIHVHLSENVYVQVYVRVSSLCMHSCRKRI